MAEKKKRVAGKKQTEAKSKQPDIVDALYDYAESLEKSMSTTDYFGEGLVCSRSTPSETKARGIGAKIKITKDGKLIGVTSSWPVFSYEQGGLFCVDSADGKGVQYVNGKGQRFKRVYGEGSASMSSGYARVEIIDEDFDKTKLQTLGKKEPKLYTFIRLNKEGKVRMMKARFSQACFIDPCGLGRVVVAGEQRIWAYVNRKGTVLPYRFANAEECFRDGMAKVTLIDGRTAYICEDGHIYRKNSSGKIIYDPTCEEVSSIENKEHFRIEEDGIVVGLKKERDMLAKQNNKKNNKVDLEVAKPIKAEISDIEITTKSKKATKDIVLF